MELDPTPPVRGGVVASGTRLLIFDADCGFCTASAGWIADRLPETVVVAGWQTLDLEQLNLTVTEVSQAVHWIDRSGRSHRGHLAIGRALMASRGFWSAVGLLLLIPPIRWAASVGYRLVARFRHRLPGATASCGVSGAETSSGAASYPPGERDTNIS